MAKQTVNIGTSANKGNGDPLRTAFTKINDNFTELYTSVDSLQSSDADLTAIAALTGTSGFLKKTAANSWALDTNTYTTLTGTETLTNKTINLTSNTLSGTTAQFNTALSDDNFATLAGTETLTNKTAGIATSSSTASSLGYLGIPQSGTATTATLAIGDAGKHIYVTTAGQTITIPANASVAYPIGTTIGFIAGPSATTVTIAITSDTMYLGGTGTTGSRTLAAHGMATAVKVAATTWYISGNGLT